MPTVRSFLTTSASMLASLAFASLALGGCAVQTDDGTGADEESEPQLDGRGAESASVGVDGSNPRTATGYKSGSAFTIHIVDADGHAIEDATASSYARMQKAAAAAGVSLRIVSGFRTNGEQQHLYDLYLAGKGNLAARPGYSNHQSGHALDLNTSAPGVYGWLMSHADEYGFKRTVPSEKWHFEYWGPMVGGSCSSTVDTGGGGGGGGGGGSTSGCHSSTLGRDVAINTCVQSRSDSKWYQCVGGGAWEIRWGVAAACSSEHPL